MLFRSMLGAVEILSRYVRDWCSFDGGRNVSCYLFSSKASDWKMFKISELLLYCIILKMLELQVSYSSAHAIRWSTIFVFVFKLFCRDRRSGGVVGGPRATGETVVKAGAWHVSKERTTGCSHVYTVVPRCDFYSCTAMRATKAMELRTTFPKCPLYNSTLKSDNW